LVVRIPKWLRYAGMGVLVAITATILYVGIAGLWSMFPPVR
jgi:hypothetical protein